VDSFGVEPSTPVPSLSAFFRGGAQLTAWGRVAVATSSSKSVLAFALCSGGPALTGSEVLLHKRRHVVILVAITSESWLQPLNVTAAALPTTPNT